MGGWCTRLSYLNPATTKLVLNTAQYLFQVFGSDNHGLTQNDPKKDLQDLFFKGAKRAIGGVRIQAVWAAILRFIKKLD